MKTKLIKIIGILVIAFSTNALSTQAQITLSLSSLTPTEPLLMFDTTNFQVTIEVNSLLPGPDTVSGDIYYWYWTDEQFSNALPMRKLEQDFVNEFIYDGFTDLVHIDIRPTEIRTDPINLIILWPAMTNPLVSDTNSLTTFQNLEGFLNNPDDFSRKQENIIFPCPAIQFIYINPNDVGLIKEIEVISSSGQLIRVYQNQEFSSGNINLGDYASGNYIVRCNYFDGEVIQTKILKY